MTLSPLLEGARAIAYRKGRFPLQLDLPPSSTLTEDEIGRVLTMASWEVPPAELAAGYEGIRGVLIGRERPISRGGHVLEALQIGGIGYAPFDFMGTQGERTRIGKGFLPPNAENFIEALPGTLMTTSRAEGVEIVYDRPSYRATGTYTAGELALTVQNTDHVSRLPLTQLVVPHVEAYGRYLDPTLANAEGPFGFIVLPIPEVKLERACRSILKILCTVLPEGTPFREVLSAHHQVSGVAVAAITNGLRELHDRGSVHLQPHMENFYLFSDATPYLVDWTTRRTLGSDPLENLYNRTLDLKRQVDDHLFLLKGIVPSVPEQVLDAVTMAALELVIECYAGDRVERQSLPLAHRAMVRLGRPADDLDVLAQGLMEAGIEGFPKYLPNSLSVLPESLLAELGVSRRSASIRSAGRNDPCPCNSGMKFKKCCGGH